MNSTAFLLCIRKTLYNILFLERGPVQHYIPYISHLSVENLAKGLLEVIFVSPQSEFLYNFTLDNPNHALRARQVEKKCSVVRKNEFISKTPLFSLSLFFWLHEVSVQDICISFLSHLLISLFPVIYFDLSITRIPDKLELFSIYPEGSRYQLTVCWSIRNVK